MSNPIPTTQDRSAAMQQLKAQVIRVLRRSFRHDPIDSLRVEIDPELNLKGWFSSLRRVYEFEIAGKKAAYKQIDPRSRKDTYLTAYLLTDYHLDAGIGSRWSGGKRRKAQCETGTPCGDTCIDKDETCQLKEGAAPSDREVEVMRQTAARASGRSLDDLDTMTFRELRGEARREKIYRYSYMTQEQMRHEVRKARANPRRQERLRQTYAKRNVSESTGFPESKGAISAYNRMKRISRLFGVDPEQAAILAAGALVVGGYRAANAMRDRYRDGLQESADMAYTRAVGLEVEDLGKKPNVMFAVGGFKGAGSTGAKIKEMVTQSAGEDDESQWIKDNNHVIAFDHPEWDIKEPDVPPQTKDNKPNPAYLNAVTRKGFGKFVNNFRRGRNEAAVDLAAQMYAYGQTYPDADINVLAHGVGGNVAREATEILARMPAPNGQGMSGKGITGRLNMVNLGTPYFGFTNDGIWNAVNFRTIKSSQDPFHHLPSKKPQWVSTVPGHEVQDYLGDKEVQRKVREGFGYYRDRAVQTNRWSGGATAPGTPAAPDGTEARISSTWQQVAAPTGVGKHETVALRAGRAIAGLDEPKSETTSRYNARVSQAAKDADIVAQDLSNSLPAPRGNQVFLTIGGAGLSSDQLARQIKTSTEMTESAKRRLGTVVPVPRDMPPSAEVLQTGQASDEFMNKQIQQHYKATVSNLLGSQNSSNEAVKLAAYISAYGSKPVSRDGENKLLPIQVLAVGDGGIVAREAMDIVAKMPNGKETLQRVQLVTMGSPHFGLGGSSARETNLIGEGDGWVRTPHLHRGGGRTTRVADVGGSTPFDYLASKKALAEMDRAFRSNDKSVPAPLPPGTKKIQEQVADLPPRLKQYDNDPQAPKNPADTERFKSLTSAQKVKEMEEFIKARARYHETKKEEARVRGMALGNKPSDKQGGGK